MTGISSPMAHVKQEPDDLQYDPHRYVQNNGGGNYDQLNNQYGSWHGGIDPSDLNMNGNLMRPSFGSQQNLSSSFIAGSSNIPDDELEDLINYDHNTPGVSGQNNYQGFGSMSVMHESNDMNQSFNNANNNNNMNGSAQIPTNAHSQYQTQIYSNTPEGNPIHSPFNHSFDYSRWVAMQPQQGFGGRSMPSSHFHSNGQHDVNSRKAFRSERPSVDAMSPMTPLTPGLNGQQLGTPDSTNFSGQSVQGRPQGQAHRKTSSMQLESPTSANNSYVDSPISSPRSHNVHVQISGVMKGGVKPMSLPAKVEHAPPTHPATTLEAKRQKRRQSHNAVERRRRDNINDRITELSRLVPQHRLEDDKIRKQLSNSSSVPQGMGGSMSPPPPTSLLAGSGGRRPTGGITQGLPLDDKDKGPPKGDVLNGAVGWTRDLMWMLYRKLNQEAELVETIKNLGGEAPIEINENEERMKSELMDSIARNGVSDFEYSRRNGTGLWVPSHTDPSGTPLGDSQGLQGFTHPFQQTDTGGNQLLNDPEFDESLENDANNGLMDFKEEDEFGMDMN